MRGQHPHLHHGHHAGQHPSRLLERFLLKPDWPLREVGAFAHHLLSAAAGIVPLLAGLSLVTVAVALTRAVQSRRLGHEAGLVRIGVPPEVDPQGALLLWSALHDLLRGRLARLLSGQPHLAWEIAASEAGTTFGLWVPRCVPEGLIERAVSSAWPGAGTTIEPVAPEQQDTAGERLAHTACELVLSGPDWFSLDAGLSPDPLPLILGQLSGLEGTSTRSYRCSPGPRRSASSAACAPRRGGYAPASPPAGAADRLGALYARGDAAEARPDD